MFSSLGIDHDQVLIPCTESDEFLMSSKRTYQGQITWSECSREIAKTLWNTKTCLRDRTRPENFNDTYDHYSRYYDSPGREWTAKAQCEIYFRDEDANVISLFDICKTLQCETPHQDGSNLTGPALEGNFSLADLSNILQLD